MPFKQQHIAFISIILVCLGCSIAVGPRVLAQSNNVAISQGFAIDGTGYQTGALVSAKSHNPRTVELATTDTLQRLVGVVNNTPLLALSGGGNEAQITVSGTSMALVSTINGDVKAGDKITASPLRGVGMKATTDGQIIGTAQTDLGAADSRTQSVTDINGNRHDIRIGLVPVAVDVSYYVAADDTFVPVFLQQFANSIAGKQVPLIRIVAASVVMVLALGSMFALLSSSVRSGIASIGRNPLAENAVRMGLLQVGGIVLLILVFALVADYLILRL